MKRYILWFVFAVVITGCKKEQNNKAVVEGLDNLSMRQIDSIAIPVTVKGLNTDEITLSVAGLAKDMYAVISEVENNKAIVSFIAKGADTGMIHPRIIISSEKDVVQQDFDLKITSHPQMAIAGYYTQINNCADPQAINNKVKITANPNGSIYIENMNIYGYPASLSGSFDPVNNYVVINVQPDSLGNHVSGVGEYKSNEIVLKMDFTDNCIITLKR